MHYLIQPSQPDEVKRVLIPHSAHSETEAQQDLAACLQSLSKQVAEPGFKPKQPALNARRCGTEERWCPAKTLGRSVPHLGLLTANTCDSASGLIFWSQEQAPPTSRALKDAGV